MHLASLPNALPLALVCAALSLGAHAAAEDTAARAVLDETAAALAKLDSLRLEATVTYTGKYDDSSESMDTSYTVAVNRAGDIALHVTNQNLNVMFFSNGDELVHYMPEFSQYIVRPRDLGVAQIFEQASFEIIDPAVNVLSALAQFKSPVEGYVIRDLVYAGAEDIDGRMCDRVRFVLNGTGYDLWVEQSPARAVRRIQPDMTALEAKYTAEYNMTFDITLTANLTTWEPNADVAQAVRFAAPDGAEKVERFGRKSSAEKMVGSPAPDFTLPLLDGGEFTLSKNKGKIILLDFWATWCGPCRIAMPVLSSVSKEFADKGVILISVDLDEEPADIKAFLESMKLDVTVALDQGGRVAGLYQVEGIPQTTIVGPDGNVHTVHVGLWAMPEMSETDTQQQQIEKLQAALTDSLRKELADIVAEFANQPKSD